MGKVGELRLCRRALASVSFHLPPHPPAPRPRYPFGAVAPHHWGPLKACLFIAASSLIPSPFLLVSCTSVHLFSGVWLLKESRFHLVSMLKIPSEAAGSFCGRVSLSFN